MLPPAEVAVIYCASIGNGGYISFKKDESPKNSTNIFNSLATFLWPVERIEVYEKVYLALKLTNNLYEFKLPSEGVKYTYRWESGELIQFEKPDDRFGRVVAAMTRQGASYKLEIDKSLISIEVVLCTSLISSTL